MVKSSISDRRDEGKIGKYIFICCGSFKFGLFALSFLVLRSFAFIFQSTTVPEFGAADAANAETLKD